MRIPLLILFSFTTSIIFSQVVPCNKTISGKIFSIEGNEPLPFATVNIVGTQQGAVSDENGNFILLDICPDEVDLEIRFLGFKPVIHHHDFHHSSPEIYLAPDAGLLEGIVVEEELNAHELKSISTKRISISSLENLGGSAADLLSNSSGVNILRTGQNVVKPIVHGLHSNRVLIINNGVRHSSQSWGSEHAPEIDPSQVDRIQLIKGASTVRYGSEALGGVILYNSPQPKYQSKLSGEVGTGYRTNGRAFSSEITLTEGYERSAWKITVNGTKQGDLKAPDYHLTNTGKQEFGYSLSTRHHFSWIDFDLLYSHFQQELGVLRGSVNGNLEDLAYAINSEVPNETKTFSYDIGTPRQEAVHDLLKFKTAIFVGEQQFDVQYAFQRNERQEFDIRRGTNNERPAINLQLNTHTFDLDWDQPSLGNWVGTLGAQFYIQNNDNLPGTNTIPFVPNFNNTSLGVFAIESYSWDGTSLEAGIRFDFLNMNVRGRDTNNDIYRDDLNYQNITFTIGISHKINDHFSISSNLGSAWRAPNVNELYSFGKHQNIIEYGLWRYQLIPSNNEIDTDRVLSNKEKRINGERGLKWIGSLTIESELVQAEITPYVNWIQNYFFIRPYGLTNTVRGTFPYFIHDQTEALYTGIDVDVRKTWNQVWSGELRAAYVFARDVINNQPFIGIPPFNIQFDIERRIGNFSIAFSPTWTAKQRHAPPVIDPTSFVDAQEVTFDRSGNFDFISSPDSFFLMNARINYETGSVRIGLTGENILNTSYRMYTDQTRYFADDLGVNVKLFLGYFF